MRLGDCYIGRLRRAEEIWQESSIIKVAGCCCEKSRGWGFDGATSYLSDLGAKSLASGGRPHLVSFLSLLVN